MDLVKKYLKIVIHILDSLKMTYFKEMVYWKIIIKKIGYMEYLKKVIYLFIIIIILII